MSNVATGCRQSKTPIEYISMGKAGLMFAAKALVAQHERHSRFRSAAPLHRAILERRSRPGKNRSNIRESLHNDGRRKRLPGNPDRRTHGSEPGNRPQSTREGLNNLEPGPPPVSRHKSHGGRRCIIITPVSPPDRSAIQGARLNPGSLRELLHPQMVIVTR